jgi:hypothetical protein
MEAIEKYMHEHQLHLVFDTKNGVRVDKVLED